MTANNCYGFLFYFKERNLNYTADNFAEVVAKVYDEYCRKYPDGLTNGGKLVKFI